MLKHWGNVIQAFYELLPITNHVDGKILSIAKCFILRHWIETINTTKISRNLLIFLMFKVVSWFNEEAWPILEIRPASWVN